MIIFFGCLGLSAIVLLFVDYIAGKYIRGDFIKLKDKKKEKKKGKDRKDLEDTDNISDDDADNKTHESSIRIEPYKEFSQWAASSKIKNTGFESNFSCKAVLVISLQYHKESQRIACAIKSVEDLDSAAYDAPVDVNFHWKLLPKKKHHGHTIHKKSTNKMFVLSFFVGPIQYEELVNTTLCVRMYGRMKGIIKKQKCYGECFIPIKSIIGKTKPVEFRKKLMPKATYVPKDDDGFHFSFGTDTEVPEIEEGNLAEDEFFETETEES